MPEVLERIRAEEQIPVVKRIVYTYRTPKHLEATLKIACSLGQAGTSQLTDYLAFLAAERLQNGFSYDEITTIPPGFISLIHQLGTPLERKALRYFGLAPKELNPAQPIG